MDARLTGGLHKAEIFSRAYARRFRGVPWLGQDDLYGYACLGLAEALSTYDASKAGWSTYSEIKIRGALLDGIRGLIGHATAAHPPPHPATMLVIDDTPSRYFPVAPNQLERVIASNRDERVRAIVRSLPRRLAVVLYLYFWREMSEHEIGTLLGICQSRVSQLMSEALNLVGKRWQMNYAARSAA